MFLAILMTTLIRRWLIWSIMQSLIWKERSDTLISYGVRPEEGQRKIVLWRDTGLFSDTIWPGIRKEKQDAESDDD
jgi:hypothetical protein